MTAFALLIILGLAICLYIGAKILGFFLKLIMIFIVIGFAAGMFFH